MQREKVEWKNWKLCSAKILTRSSKEEGKRGRKIRWELEFSIESQYNIN